MYKFEISFWQRDETMLFFPEMLIYLNATEQWIFLNLNLSGLSDVFLITYDD